MGCPISSSETKRELSCICTKRKTWHRHNNRAGEAISTTCSSRGNEALMYFRVQLKLSLVTSTAPKLGSFLLLACLTTAARAQSGANWPVYGGTFSGTK